MDFGLEGFGILGVAKGFPWLGIRALGFQVLERV